MGPGTGRRRRHPPTDAALALTRATVEALRGEPVPSDVSDLEVLLLGTGRAATPPGTNSIHTVLG